MAELDHIEKAADKGDKQAAGQPNLLDLHKDGDIVRLSKSNLMPAATEPEAMIPMAAYLQMRDDQDNHQSYFRTATTLLTRLGRDVVGSQDAVEDFNKARKEGNTAAMLNLFHADREQREFENKFGAVSAGVLKAAFLFGGGKVGLYGLGAMMTTDSARPNDPFPKQLTDVALGAAKTIATRYMFNQINKIEIGGSPLNPVSKGWLIGLSNHFIDVGLSSNTYMTPDGQIDLKGGALKTALSTFGPQPLIADAGTGAISHLALLPLNAYMGGKLLSGPLASTLTMAGVSGLTEGSLRDVNHQQRENSDKPIDWLQVAKAGAQTGTINTISVLPGALVAAGKL